MVIKEKACIITKIIERNNKIIQIEKDNKKKIAKIITKD